MKQASGGPGWAPKKLHTDPLAARSPSACETGDKSYQHTLLHKLLADKPKNYIHQLAMHQSQASM
jgi:hypothetical protein